MTLKTGTLNHLFLLGRPGCGKGIQARFLEERLPRCARLVVSDLLYENADRQEISQMDRGLLLPDERAFEIWSVGISKHLSERRHDFVVHDGALRGSVQAELMLDFVLNRGATASAIVIEFVVPRDVCIRRIMSAEDRLRGGKARADDTEEGITKRLNIFDERIFSIKNLVAQKGVPILTVKSEGDSYETPEYVWGSVVKILPPLILARVSSRYRPDPMSFLLAGD